MERRNYQVSLEAIRNANRELILNGLDPAIKENEDYNKNGFITIKTIVDGIVTTKELSKEEIKNAYAKALKEYEEEL
ncbi:MAG: hypothetical protein JO154_08715 [Chitinophaga sp.]|uniref:hypothetical protein n=1 Tax=Chitinophaga sp. TaxID=1869181 RepID=UPI0025BC4566|nr:hypothetical protein [Chitinophaga sp.]MBV8252676.1 hypothetical protein [Chitinophaga sp.]